MTNRKLDDNKLDEVNGGIQVREEKNDIFFKSNAGHSEMAEIVEIKTSEGFEPRLKTDTIREDVKINIIEQDLTNKMLKPKTSFFDNLLRRLKIKI